MDGALQEVGVRGFPLYHSLAFTFREGFEIQVQSTVSGGFSRGWVPPRRTVLLVIVDVTRSRMGRTSRSLSPRGSLSAHIDAFLVWL